MPDENRSDRTTNGGVTVDRRGFDPTNVPRWVSAILPIVLLLLVLGVFLVSAPFSDVRQGEPLPDVAVTHSTLPNDDTVVLHVTNNGPDSVTVSQVLVDEAYWSFEVAGSDGDRTLAPMESARIVIPYHWNPGWDLDVALVTSAGATFHHTIVAPTRSPDGHGTTAVLSSGPICAFIPHRHLHIPMAADGADRDTGPSPLEDVLTQLIASSRTNAIFAWLLVPVLVSVFVESLLDLDAGWIVFVGVSGLIVLVPPISARDWRVMVPWELLVIALLPILVRGLVGGTVGTFPTYLALAALALIVTVQLQQFTDLRVTPWFAITLVVLTTLAAVAAWTVFRWNADRYLGTAYLVDNESLMLEWVSVALAGLAAGLLFESYFRRRGQVLWRVIKWVITR